MIRDIFEEGLRYPFKDVKKVIILGLFSFLIAIISYIPLILILGDVGTSLAYEAYPSAMPYPSLEIIEVSLIILLLIVLIAIPMLGYRYRVIDFSIKRIDALPEFNEFGSMIMDGFKYLLARLGYGIILGMIGFILANIYSMLVVSGAEPLLIALTFIAFVLIFIIITIFVLLFMKMGIANMIKNDGAISKAFIFQEIWEIISKIGLGRYILLILIMDLFSAGIGIVIGLVTGIFAIIPIVSIIISLLEALIVTPYLNIFECRIIGSIYNLSQ